MAWYALEELDTAIEEAKELLLPFDWRLWTKIAILTFFAAGVSFPSSLPSDIDDTGPDLDIDGVEELEELEELEDMEEVPDPSDPGMLDSSMTGLVPAGPDALAGNGVMLAMLMFAVLIVMLFAVLRPIFSFAFFQSLLDREVVIGRNVKKHVWNGIQLLLFLILIGIAGIAGLGIMVGTAAALWYLVHPVAVAPIILLVFPVGLLFLVLVQLTREFVPITMIQQDVNVIQAWKRLFPVLKQEWKQTGLYIVMRFVAGLAVGIAVSILSVVVAIVLAIPVLLLFFLVGEATALLLGAIGIAAIAWVAATLYAFRGPAETFLRFYTILVYQDIVSAVDERT